MHETIPKGIVGGFELTVLQRNLREWHETLARIYVCECYRKVKKVVSVRNSELVVSHIIFRDCRLHIFSTTFLEIAVYLTDTQQVLSGDSANVIKRNWIDATIVNRLNPHEHTSRLIRC